MREDSNGRGGSSANRASLTSDTVKDAFMLLRTCRPSFYDGIPKVL